MSRLPPSNRRPFDNARPEPSPPPCGEVDARSASGGGSLPSDDLQTRARRLRANVTQAESFLWFHLRSLKQRGFHFRRQCPMRHYILDFVCHKAKLVIELDGGQHGDPEGLAYDARRTAFLNAQGFRVLRFWNGDVLHNREDVVAAILRALETPTRNASHSDLPTRGR